MLTLSLYVYAFLTIFYLFYENDFNNTIIQIEPNTKLNYTYNHTYIISNALRNAALQNM